MNLADLTAWVDEERHDLDEQVAKQDRLVAKRKPFDPPATINPSPLADARYWRHSDRSDSNGGKVQPAQPWALGDPYNDLADMTAEQVFLKWWQLRLKLARTRKPHTREAAAKESWRLRRELERMPHMLNAAAWVEDQVKASISHKRTLRVLAAVVESIQEPRRQREHHASQELRAEVIRLYAVARAAGRSERETCRRIKEATGVSRTNVQRWAAQFENESTSSLPMRGENGMNQPGVLEHIDARFDRLEEKLGEDMNDVFRAIMALRETEPEEWEAYLAERRRSTPS